MCDKYTQHGGTLWSQCFLITGKVTPFVMIMSLRRHDRSDPISIKFYMDNNFSEISTIGIFKLHSRAGKTTWNSVGQWANIFQFSVATTKILLGMQCSCLICSYIISSVLSIKSDQLYVWNVWRQSDFLLQKFGNSQLVLGAFSSW